MSTDPKKKFSADEAAKYLGIKPRLLGNLRSTGGGPPYFKIGSKVVYQLCDLEAWLATKRATETPKKGKKKPSEPRPIGRPTPLDAHA